MTTTQPQQALYIREFDEDPSKQQDTDYAEYILNGSTLTTTHGNRRWRQAPARVLQELFLPIGFPSSVNEGYLEYQLYDSLQGLCSYLRGVLCSAQVLQAAGVGKADAVALSAAMTWALKDGVSMMGGLWFSYTYAPLFDSYVKEFRLFADIINDVGLTLDMAAPYFDSLLLVSSAAGLCKSLCGLSAGATKSSITQHFALEGNMADLNAKESTQETLVSLIGMLLGITLAHQLQRLEDSGTGIVLIQWSIFSFLTVLHVWANWRGVQILRMRTLNRERAEQALKGVLDCMLLMDDDKQQHWKESICQIPTPNQVYESLIASTRKMFYSRLKLSAPLTLVLQSEPLLDLFQNERYVLAVNRKQQVLVSLLVGAKSRDQLKAFVHALYLLKRLDDRATKDVEESRRHLVQDSYRKVCEVFQEFAPSSQSPRDKTSLFDELVKKGWEVEDRLYVGFSRKRSQWTLSKEN